MSFDWHAYFELAEHLLGAAATAASPDEGKEANFSPTKPEHFEAYYRAATSKAYYSAYHQTRICIKNKDGRTFDEESGRHRALLNYLIDDRKREGRSRVGNNLKRLYQYRLKADYEDQLPEDVKPAKLASLAIAEARKITKDIKGVFGV